MGLEAALLAGFWLAGIGSSTSTSTSTRRGGGGEKRRESEPL
jgi:hypothetical protein